MRAILILVLAACSEQGVTQFDDPPEVALPGSISGRVCEAGGRSWQADAMAYTNVVEAGRIVDVRKAYSDRDGYWSLTDLPADRTYTLYVQHGTEVLHQEAIHLEHGEDLVLPDPPCFDPAALNIAVVSGDYDDVDRVLANMGFANFTLIDGGEASVLRDWMRDVSNLQQYDVIFFNGGHVEEGIFYDRAPDNDTPRIAQENLRAFVAGGGSVYASDWSYDVIERAWPDAIDFIGNDAQPNAAQVGDYGVFQSDVLDESLARFLDLEKLEIEYDLPVWPPISTVPDYVSTHLTGDVEYREGGEVGRIAGTPLLVSFSAGEGRVVYSTFRIAANDSPEMALILQYMMGVL